MTEETQEVTKECPSCKSQINAKATKCPHCQADLRSWFRRHPILTVILVLFGLGFFGLIMGGGGPSTDEQNNTGQEKVSPQPEQQVEVAKITATELADDFDANQVAAESRWEGKMVEFSATVSNITDYGISFYNVGSKEFSMAQISCKITDKEQLLPLTNGEVVTVRGVVGKQTIGVIDINDCRVVE